MVEMNFSTWHGLRSRDPRRLALGSAQWGMPYGIANASGPPNDAELRALIDAAETAGIRQIDTARAYGRAEERIGQADLAEGDWRVLTKLAPKLQAEGEGVIEALDAMTQSLSESREALGMERLPAVLLHRFQHRHLCGGRVWRALLAEREAGRIGALGVSAANPEEAWAALEDPDIEIIQVATNLLDRRLHQHGFFARARELGRQVIVRSIYLQGIAHLSPESLPEPLRGLKAPLDQIRSQAGELGVSPAALFLAFVRELPGTVALLGCESSAQLARNLADWNSTAVEPSDLARLVDALPQIPEELLDPSRWPVMPAGAAHPSGDALNQTSATSVATLPT